jgi:hypothetical protein
LYRIGAVAFVSLLLAVGWRGPGAKLQAETLGAGVAGSEYEKVFDQYRESILVTMRQRKIRGLSITVVDREGVLWAAGFGKTGKGSQAVTPQTLFSIQSLQHGNSKTLVPIWSWVYWETTSQVARTAQNVVAPGRVERFVHLPAGATDRRRTPQSVGRTVP